MSVLKFYESVMPDLIRHPETLGKTGFRLSPAYRRQAGMTPLYENRGLWTDTN